MKDRFLGYLGFGWVAIALLFGCTKAVETPPAQDVPTHQTATTNPAAESTEPRVYWLKTEAEHLMLVPENATPVMDTATNQLKKLFAKLLENPPTSESSSAIPAGTKLLDLKIQPDGIVVNLSEAFTSGGGSASMMGRVAQVLYTATSTDPKAAVWFQIEGKPLTVLGGEGLEISQPMTRAIFTENFEM